MSLEMERAGINVEFVDGRRVTTPAGLEIVRASFQRVNTLLCEAIGERAVPLLGDEIGLEATPVSELGLVGNAMPSRPQAIVDALEAGLIPVVAPVGPLNVNADEAAAALAIGLGVDELLFLTDVGGVLDATGQTIPRLAPTAARELVTSGVAHGGMQAKLEAAASAVHGGVGQVRIVLGAAESVVLKAVAGEAIGTALEAEPHPLEAK
jgi:acetylglutamate kinase